MARPIESLETLLQALGRERDLRGRLRVLSRAWTLLRSLSPAQREQVALRVGSRWAWRRIEKAFLKDGELDAEEQLVGSAFERLGDTDPRRIRAFARSIREGDTRGAKDLLLLTLTEALEEEADAQESAAPSELEAEQEAQIAEPEPEMPDSIELEEEPQPEAPEVERPRVPEVVSTADEVLASSRARRVPEPPAPATAAPAAPAIARLPDPPTPPALAADAPEPPAEWVAPAPTVEATNGTERLRALRRLRRDGDHARELGRAGRKDLLERLGRGWATRRALSQMIASRALDDLDEALEHVGRLERSGQRTWCLADLLAHWELTGAEAERVLALVPSDAARRRLERRQTRGARA